MNFRSFANRFVILLVVLALLLPGVAGVQAQTDEPQSTPGFPVLTEVLVTDEVAPVATAVPVVTEVVATPVVDPPAEPPAPEAPGISETTLVSVVQTLVWGIIALAAVVVIAIIAHGLVQGKSINELARSQPVQWGLTAAANAAAITADTEDDAWIAARAKQLGWEVTNDSGVITLKKVDIPPISPVSG